MVGVRYCLNVAGLSAHLDADQIGMWNNIEQCFKGFQAQNRKTVIEIKVVCNSSKAKEPVKKKDSMNRVKIQVNDQIDISRKGHNFKIDLEDLKGEFNCTSGKGKCYTKNWASLRFYLRTCFALKLLEKKTILLHSSAVIDKDKAYIFSGPSRAGKSTAARLTQAKLLNEDMNALKLEKNRVKVFSTPFGGDINVTNNSAVLKKMFFLKKTNSTSIKKLSPAEIFTSIISNEILGMNHLYSREPEIGVKMFNLINELAGKINAYELHFEKNRKFWKKIKELA